MNEDTRKYLADLLRTDVDNIVYRSGVYCAVSRGKDGVITHTYPVGTEISVKLHAAISRKMLALLIGEER